MLIALINRHNFDISLIEQSEQVDEVSTMNSTNGQDDVIEIEEKSRKVVDSKQEMNKGSRKRRRPQCNN
jgi:hypothetical protein